MKRHDDILRPHILTGVTKFLAKRASDREDGVTVEPLADALVDLCLVAFTAGRQSCYQNVRISLEVAAQSITELAEEAAKEEGDPRTASFGEAIDRLGRRNGQIG